MIQIRRGTTDEWLTANPVLDVGEPGLETDTGIEKIGDGVTDWVDLPVRGSVSFVSVEGVLPDQIDVPAGQVTGQLDDANLPDRLNVPQLSGVFLPILSTAPDDPTVIPVYLDTSSAPPVIRYWDETNQVWAP